jgi:hypothetical protein
VHHQAKLHGDGKQPKFEFDEKIVFGYKSKQQQQQLQNIKRQMQSLTMRNNRLVVHLSRVLAVATVKIETKSIRAPPG